MPYTMSEKILIALKRRKMTLVELSSRLGTSNQNLSSKIKRDNFTEKDLIQIAQAMGAKFEGFLIFEDDTI